MAKYYVQSGTLRTVVDASSQRDAALWAVHQAMQQVLPLEPSDRCGPTAAVSGERPPGLRVLDKTVRVGERGFDASDMRSLPTMDVVGQWNDMVAALNRLESLLHCSGTAA